MSHTIIGHIVRAVGAVGLLLPAGITDLEAEGTAAPSYPMPAPSLATPADPQGGARPGPFFVFFPPDGDRIDAAASRVLDRVAAALGRGSRLVLTPGGRPDPHAARPEVRSRRAAAVRTYLVRSGIMAQNIAIAPASPPTPEIARANPLDAVLDRRVDIVAFRPEQTGTAGWTKSLGSTIWYSGGSQSTGSGRRRP